MGELNTLFRKRIGISESEILTFASLDCLLEKTATTIPFENLRIIENNTREMTKNNLINKILVRNEGGVCYELNAVLYFFLIENGFNVTLIRGNIYDNEIEDWISLSRTHVAILLTHEQHSFLIDTGVGTYLPLKPVPLSGETVVSSNGEFRLEKTDSTHGDYHLKMKLKHRHANWKTAYTFNSKQLIEDVSEFNDIQQTLIEHPDSPFNKNPLISQLTSSGYITLTKNSFTERISGTAIRKTIDSGQFKELAKQHFGIELDQETKPIKKNGRRVEERAELLGEGMGRARARAN